MLQSKDIWLQIPPEEKFELIALSNSRGFLTSLLVIICCSTLAVGLELPWFLWSGLIVSPLVFQFGAGKAWRAARPALMLRYLAARSVARRFAYAAKAPDLTTQLLFRGKIARHFADEAQDMQAAFEEVEQAWGTNDMWIGLMNSAVVGFAERPGGGQLIFVALLDKSLTVEGTSSDGNDYSPNRELLLTLSGGTPYERGYKLTSPYPAALVAFEKKLLALREIRIKEIEISDRVKEEARSRIP